MNIILIILNKIIKESIMNDKNLKLAIKLRHELHENPEVSNEEKWTKNHLLEFLKENTKLEIVDKGKWFYAVYKSKVGKRNIAFRADFDAVAMDEGIDLPYASKKDGVAHKCGHDGHSATLAAFAMEIDEDGSDNNIFYLFQHAEESGDGADKAKELIIEENIDEISAYHNMSGMEYKSVNIIDYSAQYASKGMNIYLKGLPSHASEPEKGINPSYAVAKIISEIPDFTLEKNNEGNVLCTIVQVDLGKKAYGISASKGVLRLTIRAEIEKELDKLQGNVENFSSKVANEYNLKVEFTYNDIFPETYNHRESNDKISKVCQEKGFEFNEIKEAFRGSEDFGHYTKLTKGSICYIGNGEDYPNLHSYKYDFRDEVIEIAVELFKGLSEI